MTHFERLTALRQQMSDRNIDAYIIASSDPHISEYLPDRFLSMAWVSGFTGSAGTLVITRDFAGLWTDSRYFVQAAEQLQGSGFELVKLKNQGMPEYLDWLKQTLEEGSTLAFDGKTMPMSIALQAIDLLSPRNIRIQGQADLLEGIWEDRPGLPRQPAFLIEETQTGASALSKINAITEKLSAEEAGYHLVSSLDDVAWIFNLRGSDVKCNPVVLSYALFTPGAVQLFIDQSKLSQQDIKTLHTQHVEVLDYTEIETALQAVPSGSTVWLDPKKTCFELYSLFPADCRFIKKMNPSTWFKAIKNPTELENIRHTMVQDGVALTSFFYWLEQAVETGGVTEMMIADKLKEFRGSREGFLGESFDTIAGYRHHGALPHYKATPESNLELESEGLLLIDSGGQYTTGTTDITRVVSLGKIQAGEKEDYTLVLRGMIEGSSCVFPEGTRGYQIDAVTRHALWNKLRNYGHGTGHGVGFFLNVHEGPQVFNTAAVDIPVEPGMVSSIEPGIYREGAYGIRIENLVNCQIGTENEFGRFLSFETLTLCYIETALIDPGLLEPRHIAWLNAYHKTVFEQLSPHLGPEEKAWLEEKTKSI